MNILNASNISKSYVEETLFDNIKVTLNSGDTVGLVGRNGEGKTTLLRLLAGLEKPSEGIISWKKNVRIGYLNQIPDYENDTSVYKCLKSVFQELNAISEQLETIENKMAEDIESITTQMSRYGELQTYYEENGGYEIDAKIRKVTYGLNIDHLLDTEWGNLSGGERTKVGLAQMLIKSTDLLLLDEPTNHLDIKSIEWLANYIENFDGATVIVSHDRYFLDETVDQIIEIDQKMLHIYNGNYSNFVEEREKRLLVEFEAYKTQQKKIKKMKESIKQLRTWASQAKPPNAAMYRRAKSMEKSLNRIERLEKPTLDSKKMNMKLEEGKRVSNRVIEMENVAKGYDYLLFENVNMLVRRGEHVAIIGDNGTGKSTLLKIILGLTSVDAGAIKTANNLKIGYLSQHEFESDNDDTLLNTIRGKINVTEGEARHILANFMFYGKDVFKKVKDLSGGEKIRLRWAQIVNTDYNLLVLDEPTNHLDIDAKETIEDALLDFEGSIITVSHDRYFLNKLFNTTYLLKNKTLEKFEGNYNYIKEKFYK
ncbi:ATP-binding cassette domain-containing protein [Staphylococcus epidermidis]|jgi:ATP-binding cassette subfamily F protein 3|uniref:ribosomal protection-like ABC-F family protein n=1 Tax=Staphylococcus epidermidis TaxID=1282 RepID=UPI00066CE5FC|nr:ABC-F family ATP-binding cassette domain-containing protein [Staphylococcus epidermidis]EAE5938933.1 ABC-F family ATP-binding cassette domain-containing protein [Listeria monocytogenes]CAC7269397.1 ABC transporter ATP-binding protein [Staphylococcus aureus]MBM0752540.1 ABC transporter ATP-binding protein [Staphylococcus epidermidis]MBM0765238.1 ABC transporter ATP-binding protein [Staphylococcus epidermidis]MBM0789513.1 ABC transporter ATP-binding protein [Staphylococcus epidermidis]